MGLDLLRILDEKFQLINLFKWVDNFRVGSKNVGKCLTNLFDPFEQAFNDKFYNTNLCKCITGIINIYKLGDVGITSNLIGLLSLTNLH